MFIDEVRILVKGGSGGNGCVSFRREKFVPRGGPNGGDGGDGGDIVIRATKHLNTLLDLRYQIHYTAKNGTHGQGADKTGKSAEDTVILVPEGTLIFTEDKNLVADLLHEGDSIIAARGGKGGRGNARFMTMARKAPRFAEMGEAGEERWLKLELKLIADIGIIGFPNAGKSTLISSVSNCKAKIADYPFTTLVPNLGVVRAGDNSFTMADIPGLIQGAHEGHGLGDRFLRHVERTKILLHLIDSTEPDLITRYQIIRNELEFFNPALIRKKQVVALNKSDAVTDSSTLDDFRDFCRKENIELFLISAAARTGISELVFHLYETLKNIPPEQQEEESFRVYRLSETEHPLKVFRSESGYSVTGTRIEKITARVNFDNPFALEWYHSFLRENGVMQKLVELGITAGETVSIGNYSFEYQDD